MKLKNISLTFGLLGLMLLGFSSCSDDDNDNPSIDWGVITKTYTGTNLQVDEVEAAAGTSIKIEGTSNETAKVILNNIAVGEPELSMNTILRRNGNDYTLEASNSNEDRDISVKGTIVGDKMTTTITTKIKSPIMGNWTLKDSINSKNTRVADMITRIDFGKDDSLGFMKNTILGALDQFGINGEGLAKAVEYVNVSFGEDGKLGISFKETKAGSEEINLSQFDLGLRYYTKASTNKVYIAINKEVIKTFLPLLGGLTGNDIDPSKILSLLEDTGAYYALPLNFNNKGNYTQVYVSKDYLAKIVVVANDLKLIPADFSFVVEWLQDLNSEENKDVVIDLGLGFNKK